MKLLVPLRDNGRELRSEWRLARFLKRVTVANLLTMDESDVPEPQVRITSRLIDSLYTEAMLLADEARSYFDDAGRDDRGTLEPFARVGFACESLKVTTRIMHIVAWLLTQRAVESGEIPNRDGRRPERRLGHAQDSDQAVVVQLPEAAQRLINSSADLYARVKRLDDGTLEAEVPQSPARALMGRLERGLSGGGSL
jgi:regulator of CtrA degradation